MAYSTCSLNPLENESVVAELLRRTRGAVELVDASGMLPEMARSPGLHDWQARTRCMPWRVWVRSPGLHGWQATTKTAM